MQLAEEDFFLVGGRPAHQREPHVLIGQRAGVGAHLVIHHEGDEGAPGALGRQLAGDGHVGRHLRVGHPLQLVGVGVRKLSIAAQQIDVFDRQCLVGIARPAAVPALARAGLVVQIHPVRAAAVMRPNIVVGVGKLIDDFAVFVFQ